jgi:hypothetical protein
MCEVSGVGSGGGLCVDIMVNHEKRKSSEVDKRSPYEMWADVARSCAWISGRS